MTTRVYLSTDSGAPVLNGQSGSLANLLYKCLVDGYGSNDPAGWTLEYSGTNTVAFRNSLAAGGTGCHVRIADNTSNNARLVVYKSMSAIDVGTDPAPSESLASGGYYIYKSSSGDSTPRAWMLIADERTFYMCCETSPSWSNTYWYWNSFSAGDFEPETPGDEFAYYAIGSLYASSWTGGFTASQLVYSGSHYGMALGRSHTMAEGSVHAWPVSPVQSGTPGFYGLPAAGDPGSGKIYCIPAMISTVSAMRGYLRGAFLPLNQLAMATTPGATRIADVAGLPGPVRVLANNVGGSGLGGIYVSEEDW